VPGWCVGEGVNYSQTIVHEDSLYFEITNLEIHKIYMDNLFTSHELLSILANNFLATGTAREHRMSV
jgi:hypothetical protein